jgi:hypothetical protein
LRNKAKGKRSRCDAELIESTSRAETKTPCVGDIDPDFLKEHNPSAPDRVVQILLAAK